MGPIRLGRPLSGTKRKRDPKKHPRSKLAIDSGILVDKARLLDGESTENISVHVVTERIESRKKRLEELYKEVGI